MGTTAEKLNAALISKEAVKQALTEQGFDVPDDFSTYADFINVLGLTSDIPIVTTGGSGAAYTATVPGTKELKVGMKVTIIPHVTSTSKTATLNLNGLGAKAIRQPLSTNISATTPLYSDNWLVANKPVTLMYNGTQWVAELVRLDANTVYGAIPIANGGTGATSLELAQQNLGIISQDEIPNLYVWKKYNGDPNTIVETDVTNQQIAWGIKTTSYGTSSYSLQYADEITIQDGVISLVEPTTLTVGGETGTPSDFNVILGKYIYGGSLMERGFFYIPSDATITISTDRIAVKASKAKKITKPTMECFVASKESGTYPTNGQHTDGYWYEYIKQLGEDKVVYESGSGEGGSTGGSDITVDSALSETSTNPVQNKVVTAKFKDIENAISGLGGGSSSGGSSSGGGAQPDWNQNDSTAADYIKNRPFYKETDTLFDGDVTIEDQGDGLLGNTEPISMNMPESVNLGDMFDITFDDKKYSCELKYEEYLLRGTYLGNIYIYIKFMCDSNGFTPEDISNQLGVTYENTGEPFLIMIGEDDDGIYLSIATYGYNLEVGTYPLKLDYVSNIKKLDSSMIDWAGGGAPSGLPEVTEEDNDKALVVVDGKWAVASIANGDEVYY